MKAIIFLLTVFLSPTANAAPTKFVEIASTSIDTSRVTLLRSIDLADQRKNGDGNLFYRTKYKVALEKEGGRGRSERVLATELYTPQDLKYNGDGMRPAFLIDPIQKALTIFAIGKGPDNTDYNMVGYAFRLDSSREWSKEVVFDSGNIGWYSYFGGADNGNPEIWHFSYHGYRQARSTRGSDGRWRTEDMGRIRPEAAVQELQAKKNILISGTPATQYPAGHGPSSSSTGKAYSESDVAVGNSDGSGDILFSVLKWLLAPPSGGGGSGSSSGSIGGTFVCTGKCTGSWLKNGSSFTVSVNASSLDKARENAADAANQDVCKADAKRYNQGMSANWVDVRCQAQ